MKTAHERMLDRLAQRLRTAPMTARTIAGYVGCCVPTAYKRVRELIARGDRVTMKAGPRSKRTGPRAVLYSLRAG